MLVRTPKPLFSLYQKTPARPAFPARFSRRSAVAPRGTQLRYLEGELVERAASLLGADVVRELRVRVDAPSARRGR